MSLVNYHSKGFTMKKSLLALAAFAALSTQAFAAPIDPPYEIDPPSLQSVGIDPPFAFSEIDPPAYF
jgi:hypothetical protein